MESAGIIVVIGVVVEQRTGIIGGHAADFSAPQPVGIPDGCIGLSIDGNCCACRGSIDAHTANHFGDTGRQINGTAVARQAKGVAIQGDLLDFVVGVVVGIVDIVGDAAAAVGEEYLVTVFGQHLHWSGIALRPLLALRPLWPFRPGDALLPLFALWPLRPFRPGDALRPLLALWPLRPFPWFDDDRIALGNAEFMAIVVINKGLAENAQVDKEVIRAFGQEERIAQQHSVSNQFIGRVGVRVGGLPGGAGMQGIGHGEELADAVGIEFLAVERQRHPHPVLVVGPVQLVKAGKIGRRGAPAHFQVELAIVVGVGLVGFDVAHRPVFSIFVHGEAYADVAGNRLAAGCQGYSGVFKGQRLAVQAEAKGCQEYGEEILLFHN